jgi:hypothetical protein
MKTRLALGLLAFVGLAMGAAAQSDNPPKAGLPSILTPGGKPDAKLHLDAERHKLANTFGLHTVYDYSISIRGVRCPKSEDYQEIRNRHSSRYPVIPPGRLNASERAELERLIFAVKRAEEHDIDKTNWDIVAVHEVMLRRLEKYQAAVARGQSVAWAITHVPAEDGSIVTLIVIGGVRDGDEVSKALGVTDAKVVDKSFTGEIDRKDMPEAPELPEDPMDLIGIGCAFLNVRIMGYPLRAVDYFYSTPPDPKRSEAARALAKFVQETERGVIRNRAIIALARWATAEQAALLQELARDDNPGVSKEAKSAAFKALTNLKGGSVAGGGAANHKLPKNLDEATPEQLADGLPGASLARRTDLLKRLEEGKGVRFSEALADIIPRLDAKDKVAARAALQRRMMRMSAKTLGGYLGDRNTELTLAAIGAVGEKKLTELAPELVKVVEAGEAEFAPAAHAALEQMTGQSFTTPPAPTVADWKKLAKQWRAALR